MNLEGVMDIEKESQCVTLGKQTVVLKVKRIISMKVSSKKNKTIYSYPDGGKAQELKYIFDEVPVVLIAQLFTRRKELKTNDKLNYLDYIMIYIRYAIYYYEHPEEFKKTTQEILNYG